MWRFARDVSFNATNSSNTTNHSIHVPHSNHTSHFAHEDGTEAVLFLFLAVMTGAMVRFLFKRLPIPYTVMLIICGLGVGFAAKAEPAINRYTSIAHMNPHLLLHVFLPILIFESAFSMNVHTFKKTLSQTLVLAGPGLMISTILTAIMARYIFTYNWNWFEAITFGCVLSATDPVAVVALLKELGASKRLGITIEGESLLNDGFAIVLFKIFLNFVIPDSELSGINMFTFILKIIICGPLVGIGMARVTLFILSHVYNDALVEITLTLASTYITFYIGEEFEISGVLAVLILGIEINSQRANISPEVEVFLHRFWSMLEYLANTLIFIIVGVVIADSVFIGVEAMDWLFLVTLYVGLQVIRLIAIGSLWPILTKIGYSISWKSILVMTWGGLRGAVGLALALIVSQDPRIVSPTLGSKFLFHTAGIVLMSLLINATSIKYLLRVLGMFDISVAKLHTMRTAVSMLRRDRRRSMNMLKSDKFLADSAWEVVEKNTRIRNPYRIGKGKTGREHPLDNPFHNAGHQCPNCDQKLASMLRPKEIQELREEVRQRIIKAEKISYWKQFELGMLDREAVRVLLHTADTVIDQNNRLIEMKDIQHHWRVPYIVTRARLWLERLITLQNKYENRSVPEPRVRCIRPLFRAVNSPIFDYIMICIVVTNVLAILIETLLFYLSHLEHYSFIIINTVFFLVYIAEFILKLIGLRQHYFYSAFNILDFLVLIFSIIDTPIMITMFILPSDGSNSLESSLKNFAFIKAIRIVRIIRFGRVLRLTKLFLPLCLKVVEYFLNRKLKFGYDVGKGYVVGKEEMMKTLCNLTFTPQPILNKFIIASETARLDTTKQLGLIRKDQPGIAVSIKTTQATRSVLNKCSETIRELQSRGIIDESEAMNLNQQIEARKKNVQHAPYSIDSSDPRVLLQNLPWVYGLDTSAIDYIMQRAVLTNFEMGQVIIRQGDPPDGIHLIINGLAKITQNSALSMTDPNMDERSRRFSKVQGESWPEMAERTLPPVLEEEEGAPIKKCGSCQSDIIPTEEATWSDFIGTGIVLGEMGVLLNSRKNATVVCEISVQTLFIQMDTLFEAIDLFPALGDMLWKVLGTRIAGKLLLSLMEYDEYTSQEMQLLCQEAYIQTPQPTGAIFVEDKTKHVVLIVGACCDEKNHSFSFKSPEIIPPGVRVLRSLDPDTKLLVIPKESLKANKEIDEKDESEDELDLAERVTALLSALPHVGRLFARQASEHDLQSYSDISQGEDSAKRTHARKLNASVRRSIVRLYPGKHSGTVHTQETPIRHSQIQGSVPSSRDNSLHTPSMAVSYLQRIEDGET